MVRAPFYALAMLPAIALCAATVQAQAVADPGRSADAAFVAKASDATAVGAELATLAAARAHATDVKALAKRVLDSHTALEHELAAMKRTAPIAGAPHAEPPDATPATVPANGEAVKTDPPSDGMKAVAALRSHPSEGFDAAFVDAMIASREAVVALFEAESRDGRDAEIKEWAARQRPGLRDQLVAARALRPRPSS
jgi:putative membrane protein